MFGTISNKKMVYYIHIPPPFFFLISQPPPPSPHPTRSYEDPTSLLSFLPRESNPYAICRIKYLLSKKISKASLKILFKLLLEC